MQKQAAHKNRWNTVKCEQMNARQNSATKTIKTPPPTTATTGDRSRTCAYDLTLALDCSCTRELSYSQLAGVNYEMRGWQRVWAFALKRQNRAVNKESIWALSTASIQQEEVSIEPSQGQPHKWLRLRLG